MILVVATHGEGDPPQPVMDFFEFVEGPKAAKLPDLRLASSRKRHKDKEGRKMT